MHQKMQFLFRRFCLVTIEKASNVIYYININVCGFQLYLRVVKLKIASPSLTLS